MRAREFTLLNEFVPTGVDTDVEQEKEDIMVLLGFKPSPDALSKVQNILGDLTPQQQPTKTATVPAEKVPPKQFTPAAEPVQSDPEDTELKEDSSLINALVERIKKLDPSNPADASKITKIESILEEDIIAPAIVVIVDKKFNKGAVEKVSDYIKNSIIAAQNPVMEKIKFLTKCNKGLVNLKATFTKNPIGNMYSMIDDQVFNNIKQRLGQFELGTGSNKIGKMETLLAFIGTGASKQGAGDLSFSDGSELEIKASSQDRKGSPSGAAMYALGKDKTTGETAYGSNFEAKQKWEAKMRQILPTVPVSLNATSITKHINPYIAGNSKKIKYTVDAIKEIYAYIFKNADSTMLSPLNHISSKDGIDSAKLIKAARQIEFDYYKQIMKHDAILFINADTGNYHYAESGEELIKTLGSGKKGSSIFSTGILDMNGTYANGLSKIFII